MSRPVVDRSHLLLKVELITLLPAYTVGGLIGSAIVLNLD